MKKCFNIFARSCPHCHRIVPWSKRFQLLEKQHLRCTGCKTYLTINPRDKIINTFLFTVFFSTYLSISETEIFSFNTLFMFLIFVEICRAFNLLFSFVRVGQKLKSQTD